MDEVVAFFQQQNAAYNQAINQCSQQNVPQAQNHHEHEKPLITAEKKKILENNNEAMKTLTNFLISEFNALYVTIQEEMT